MIDYFGEYFRSNLSFPAVLISPENIGLPNPIFYGHLFYPLFGSAAAVSQAGLSIRIFTLLLFLSQFYWAKKSMEYVIPECRSKPLLIITLCCLINWTIYPLTNLYDRAALAEFFAVGCVTCATLTWITYAYSPSQNRQKPFFLWSFFLFATFAAGFHPITAVFSGLIFGLCFINSYRQFKSIDIWPIIKASLLPLLLSILILLPIAYVTFGYAFDTTIGRNCCRIDIFSKDIDSWVSRFFPLPLDLRMLRATYGGLNDMIVPYLEAQINMPLLILWTGLAIWLIKIRRHQISLSLNTRFIVVPFLAFTFFATLSLSEVIYDFLPEVFQRVQFAYRFTSYQNLVLILAIVYLFSETQFTKLEANGYTDKIKMLCLACIVLSACGLVIKLTHVQPVRTMGNFNTFRLTPEDRKTLIVQPREYYGMYDYLIPDLYPTLPSSELANSVKQFFPVSNTESFGKVEPIAVDYPQPIWIRTQVMAFPWNRLVLDNQIVDPRDLRLWEPTPGRVPNSVAIKVPAGKHELRYQFMPDKVWHFLNRLSGFALLLFLLGYAFHYFRSRTTEPRRSITFA